MRITRKYYFKFLMLLATSLCFMMQANAQFDDDEGPGGFDPPPPNDVPLDSYQWVMMILSIAYGIYIFWKHYKKNLPVTSKTNTTAVYQTAENPLSN